MNTEQITENAASLTDDEQHVLMRALDEFHANRSTYGAVFRAVEAILADRLARVLPIESGREEWKP